MEELNAIDAADRMSVRRITMRLVGTEGVHDIAERRGCARDLALAESMTRWATGRLPDVILDRLNADYPDAATRPSCRHEAGAGYEQRSEAIGIAFFVDEDCVRVVERRDDGID